MDDTYSTAVPPERLPEVDAVTRWFTRVFADLEKMNADFCEVLERESRPQDPPPVVARLGRDGLKRRARRFLNEHPHVDGAGMIFARSSESDDRGILEWWEKDAAHGVNRYSFGVHPTGDRYYDYEDLEWFVMSYGSGRRWITGPYIDYLGVDEYVITLTTRGIVHGRPIGVAGIDMKMGDLEREILPLLQRFPARAALVSPHGSILVSNHSSLVPGERIDGQATSMTVQALGIPDPPVRILHD